MVSGVRRMEASAVRTIVTLGIAGLLLVGCQADPADEAPTDQAAEVTEGVEEEVAPEEEPEPEGAQFHFAYTGEGEEGCTLDGPNEVVRGRHTFSIVNEHGEDQAIVNVQRLAEGYGYDDFLEVIGEERPARPPDEQRNPDYHDWMEGDWRVAVATEHGGEGTQDVTLAAGSYVIFCWGETPDPTEPSKLWPSGALEVTDS